MGRPEISVLLVEDDEADAKQIQIMLKRAEDVKFSVQVAHSLKAALQVVEMAAPDIVLLDLSLPDYQGYDTVVEYTRNATVPFVVLTGNEELQMAMRSVDLGAQDYVLKNQIAAKPLERSIIVATRRAYKEQVHRSLEIQSREVVFEDNDKATVSMLRPQISHLVEGIEDIVGFLRKSAPGLSSDVQAIMDKHGVDVTIKELRDTLRLHADRGERRRISEQGMRSLKGILDRRTLDLSEEEKTPVDVPDAVLLEIIERRKTKND
jgi:CheY-like chemotaxis protein